MDTTSQSIEAVRARYRPERIVTMFVGKSAPASGKFFYGDENLFAHHIRQALLPDATNHRDFLNRFKSCGWFLDDLVLEPIDAWKKPAKLAARRAARDSLASRIREYRPRAIVSLLMCIREIVKQAAHEAGSGAELFAVPFPGHGHQKRFREQMAVILPHLPTLIGRP